MEWDDYKALCDRPNVWSRWMLEETLELIGSQPDLDELLAGALRTGAVEKPADHSGGELSDMFELQLQTAEVERICEIVRIAVAAGQTTGRTRRRGLGGFCEAWDEYRRFAQAAQQQQQ